MLSHCYTVDLRLVAKKNMILFNVIMKNLVVLISTLLTIGTLSAQKKVLDLQAINTWPNLNGYGISNDGKYIWYVVDSGRIGSTLSITNASGKRRISYSRCYGPKFSNDSKNILFTSEKGIYRIRLHDFSESFTKGARDLKVSEHSSWVSFQQDNQMKLVDIENGSEIIMRGVVERWFDPLGKNLLIKYQDSLCLFNLANRRTKNLFSGHGVESICFNNSGSQLLFSVADSVNTSIFKYSSSFDRTELIISNNSPGIGEEILLSGQGLGFNNTSDVVFFKYKIVQKAPRRDSNLITEFVDIWNYKDRFLQSQQLLQRRHRESAAFDPDHLYQGAKPLDNNGEILLLENSDTAVHRLIGNKYAIIKNINNDEEVYWNENEWPSFQLISLKDGSRTDFLKSKKNVYQVELSPSDRFITWADSSLKKYYCYNIETKRTITLMNGEENTSKSLAGGIDLDGWMAADTFLICHDDYDLWQIDPLGVKGPICITAGYGKSNKIIFAPIDDQDGLARKKGKDEMIVAAMDESTNDNGFYQIKLSMAVRPKRLLWGPYIYYFPGLFMDSPKPPLKALNATVYLITRQSDTQSPNLILTKDFVHQDVLTDIHPEETINWHNAQLVTWTTKYGEHGKGIFYVPNDLDTTKKYPIIFNYYEKRSGELRKYQRPELSAVNINIPFYINKGYLVFVPDITPKRGHTFENALDIIESGALYLTEKYSWIDKYRMGLQGQSFGGTVTNFVATHSKLFAAAQASAGRTDFISCYGGVGFGGISLQGKVEFFQNKLAHTPWDRPDVYINNSAIFGAGNCVTPLLIVHGTDDGAVNIGQAVELFTALRRAGKKVWFLQYAAGHVMDPYSEIGRDFIQRQTQFFDHYLKGMPAPIWMTQGVSTKYKGIRSGLALDGPNAVP